MIPLFTIPPGGRSRTTPRCRLHYRGNVSFKAMKEPAHLALHCWSWRAGLARSGHAEHRQSRAAGYVAGAAPTVPGRLVAERDGGRMRALERSEEHTSELQSLMLSSYAVFCLKKKNKRKIEC